MMAGSLDAFNVLVEESRTFRLLLSEGLAMFTDPSTHSSKSFVLRAGSAKIDFHKTTGHIRLVNLLFKDDPGLIFRVLPKETEFAPSAPISGGEHLSAATLACLDVIRSCFETLENSLVTLDANNDYSSQTALSSFVASPLPSVALSFPSYDVSHPLEKWVVARVTDYALGKPATAFYVSSSAWNQDSLVRVRLHASFAALGAKLLESNPKIPVVPSNWRRDQSVLQKELDFWLLDLIRLEPLHPALASFLSDANDAFSPQGVSGSSSGYLSYAFGSMMEPKPYIPLFSSTVSVKPITLLVGTSGSSKSSFINHMIGFPVCEPVGVMRNANTMVATFYEILAPFDFVKMARFEAYWTHPQAFHIANYPPGTSSIAVEPNKLQQPITEGLEASWKNGGAFFILDHAQTLDRFRLGPASTYRSIQFRTCIINEAALDPIRLEFEIAKANIFVEFNNFDSSLQQSVTRSAIQDSSSNATASSSQNVSFGDDGKSERAENFSNLSSRRIPMHPQLVSHLLEIAFLRQRCNKLMYFAALDAIKRATEDLLWLELTELLCMNQDTFQFSHSLATWVEAATSKTMDAQRQPVMTLDLIKLLGLMKNWISMLPTPRRSCQILFLTTEEIPNEAIQHISKSFTVHDILHTEGKVIKTRDTLIPSFISSPLDASVNNQSSNLAVVPHTTVYEHLIPTKARTALFASLLGAKMGLPL
jgi:hypothetical protein